MGWPGPDRRRTVGRTDGTRSGSQLSFARQVPGPTLTQAVPSTGVIMSLAERFFLTRAEAVARKAAHQRRRALERELADYNTPAQRLDLEATLDRFPDGVTHELREILSRQQLTQ